MEQKAIREIGLLMTKKHSLKLVLIHTSGDKLYPCTMKDRSTGNVAFRVTPPGGGNTKENALQVNELEMLDYVKNKNYRVRCSTLYHTSGKDKIREGLYGLKERSIISYEFS